MGDYVEAVSSDGRRVLEAELGDGDAVDWIHRARKLGAQLLWLHADADIATLGFERFPGYVRLRADSAAAGAAPLPRLQPEEYARTLAGAYRGLWGHKLVPADAEPAAGAVVLGLYERDEAVGLCTVFPAERLVDGPGVIGPARDPAAYARLLLGACAELGPGPIDLDSWGDSPAVIAAYGALGFAVVERVDGWELELDQAEPSDCG